MTVQLAGQDEVDWIVRAFSIRRSRLTPHAPVFWKPAPDSFEKHGQFLTALLTNGQGVAYRTKTGVLVASRGARGLVVDDFHVNDDQWGTDGISLWSALRADHNGDAVRLVSPTYEPERSAFAIRVGLQLAESWWLLELPDSGGGEAGVRVSLPGGDAVAVEAPPVYSPPGPILFWPSDGAVDPGSLSQEAVRLGCAGVVVNRKPGPERDADNLSAFGFRRHSDFFHGVLNA